MSWKILCFYATLFIGVHRIGYIMGKLLISRFFNILIIGDTDFINATKKALDLIRTSDLENWSMVAKYMGIITSAEKSGMKAWVNPPVFEVGPDTAKSDTHWYAGSICHDAYHSKLYKDYYEKHGNVPYNIWTGRHAENLCLDVQIKFLKKINAPKEEIQYLEKMKHIDYFSNYSAREW